MKWAKKAYQSTYGYEYQGDSLLTGRINLLFTFVENYESRWVKQPSLSQIRASNHNLDDYNHDIDGEISNEEF